MASGHDPVDGALADVESARHLYDSRTLITAYLEYLAVPFVTTYASEPAWVIILALGQGASQARRRYVAPVVTVWEVLRDHVHGGNTFSACHGITYS